MRPVARILAERPFENLALPGAGFQRCGGVFDGFGIGVGPELSGKHAERVGLHWLFSGGAASNATGTPERWNAAPSCQLSKCSKQQGWAPLEGLKGGPPSR